MAVKLHRCTVPIKGPHPCWKVEHALQEAGIAYDVVRHPPFPRSRRKDLERVTGQRTLPALEFEDGTTLREESKDLIARIGAGAVSSATAPS